MTTGTTGPLTRHGPSPRELTAAASRINLVAAALAYVATNPSRVLGLGIITEPVLAEFGLTRTAFGQLNFWATVVVAVPSFAFGSLVDRLGLRRSYVVILAALAGATMFFSLARNPWELFLGITLTRMFGQGILALVSTALLGKSFGRGAPYASAVFLLFTGVIYGAVVKGTELAFAFGLSWREVWQLLAVGMLLLGVTVGLFAVTEPRIGEETPSSNSAPNPLERTVWQAIRSPLFLVYGTYCFVTVVANSGMSFFFESLLKDRGFSKDVFFDAMIIGIVGMALFKFVIAWLCHRWSMGRMMAIAMLLNALALALVSFLETTTHVYLWSILKALSYGIFVVVYFSIWGYAFGRRDLARVQGAVHVLTVSASGIGPWLFGLCRDRFDSYLPCLHLAAMLSLLLGISMLTVRVPCAERSR